MRRATILLLLTCTSFFAFAPAAFAAKRVALVVGIDKYDHLPAQQQLKKALNDAHAVSETLKDLGYDVIEANNVARLEFLRQWQQFLNRIEPGDEAAFFFAGHGVEIGGLNFLLPRDVPRVASGEDEVLKASGVSLSSVLEQVRERNPQIGLYIIDACRDNPFTDAKGRGIGATRGLARVEPPSGTFIMFSAGAKESALDRLSDGDRNPNSVYTRALLPELKAPGKSITDIARDVRREVRESAQTVNHVQTPAYYDEVVGEFCPAGCDRPAEIAAVEPAPTPPAPPAEPEAAPVANSEAAPAPEQEGEQQESSQSKDVKKELAALPPPGSAPEQDLSTGIETISVATEKPPVDEPLSEEAKEIDSLAGQYAYGLSGKKENQKEAARLYLKLADMAGPNMVEEIAGRFEIGAGVPEDHVISARLNRKAAEMNQPRAMVELGRVLQNGDGVAENDVEALKWFREAIRFGSADGMFYLGMAYRYGEGVRENDVEAIRWFRLAAERGETTSMSSLAEMYEKGEGTAKDPSEAERWRQAAEAAKN